MIFLQPWLLLALPLILLPIIIHLINQWRFQTIPWAAMMFLLSAHKMARGYSRLRQWLIMLLRVLAIAALLFAVSRPLAGGWLGLAAGERGDTTLILLDRSPSMQWRNPGSAESKLKTACRQLRDLMASLQTDRYVVIDSVTYTPLSLQSADLLTDLSSAQAASSSADIPRLLEVAHHYVRDNKAGKTEIWICSDVASNDWESESGRWRSLRESFSAFPQSIRFHLLAYQRHEPSNLSIRVTDVRRLETSEKAELLISFRLTRTGKETDKLTVPVQWEIEGSRSSQTVELVGPRVDIRDHSIPIDRARKRGWGRVSIPTDINPADDDFYFVFDQPPPRKTLLVTDDPSIVRPLELAAQISSDPSVRATAEIVQPDQLTGVDWDQLALVLWQSALPQGVTEQLVTSFIDRGGQVAFFPPKTPTGDTFLGLRWTNWKSGNSTIPIDTWQSNEGPIARTMSGAALPVGDLEIRRYCGLEGECSKFAVLQGGEPLLARAPAGKGHAYLWTTTPSPADSSLGTNGVVLYAFVQRVIAAGADALSKSRQLIAGETPAVESKEWVILAETDQGLSTESAHHRGAYRSDDRLIAVNRSLAEDEGIPLSDDRVAGLFTGLDFSRVDDRAGSTNSMVQEIWRTFLIAMLLALIAEAILCLPKGTRKGAATK
ncbi:BatA domain-containing protein [bacterium]|nr:BatA domain-containing protein [bacterium]